MSLTLGDLLTLVEDDVGASGADERLRYARYVNMAARDVLRAHPWSWRRTRAFVNTVAPYETGTVALTNDSKTVTGTGTTFTSAMVGRKFALSISGPWYKIKSYTSSTVLTLEEAYQGVTVSGSTYAIYNDVVALPANVDTILSVYVHRGDVSYPLRQTNDPFIADHMTHYPQGTQEPQWYVPYEVNASGARQIKVGPYAPDAVYRIEILYLKTYTDMTGDADVCDCPEETRDLILFGSLAHAFRRDHFQRSAYMSAEFRQGLRDEWARDQEALPVVWQLGERGPSRSEFWPVDTDDLEIV